MQRRVYIETWGCQMNVHQSEGLAGVMAAAGYTAVGRLEGADVVLFNGCIVRQKAEEKVYGRIGAVMAEKRRRPVVLGVGGCLGQIHGESLLKRFPAIDFVFGSGSFQAMPELVRRAREERCRPVARCEVGEIEELPYVRGSTCTAMVTITEGCSNRCSYCIVPHARGVMRSRHPQQILREVERAAASGALEVLLLGQNVNAYGKDRPEFGDFATLLPRIAATGVRRIRFTTSHPLDFETAVLDVMASSPNICNHLHLPIQSGSDRILAAMRRGYTTGRYLAMVEEARQRIAGLNVTTDLIVGYPGESASDFAATLDLLDEVRFGSVFVAKYSPRPLTESARAKDDVPEPEKADRLARVLARQRRISREENLQFLGQEVEVLFEAESRDGQLIGRARDHRTVVASGGGWGEMGMVRVEAASAAGLAGAVRQEPAGLPGAVRVRQGTEGRR